MERLIGKSSVDTKDELNKLEVYPDMDSSVVDFVPYSSLVGTLKEICGLSYKDVIEMKFDYVEDAGAFYHGYSRAVGFDVKLSNKIHDSEDRDINKYIVRAFEENYCHKLATFREVAYVLSHRNIDAKDLTEIDAMGNCCIRPCLTYEYMVTQKGGYSKIGFTQKDMYNRIDAKRLDEAFESDSHAALMFNTDEKDSLANIFWRDSHSLFEYQCFRDVLVFDNTYKTNSYANPLVLYVVVNDHHATCVFRVILLSDKTIQSYRRVLNSLMDSMGHKHPIYILTNGDEAMRQAANKIFPNSQHRICEWHECAQLIDVRIMNESQYTHIASEKEDNCRVYHLSRYEFPDKKRKVVYHLDRVCIQEVDGDGD
ncbi:hypothetical protein Ddye_023852, partial [Dipteronia dyeriana]